MSRSVDCQEIGGRTETRSVGHSGLVPRCEQIRMTTAMRAIKESSPAVARLVERPSPMVLDPEAPDSKDFSLTRQERRVFILLGDGLSNKALARVLGLRESTVKSYVTAVLNKTGCRNRTQAAVLSLHFLN